MIGDEFKIHGGKFVRPVVVQSASGTVSMKYETSNDSDFCFRPAVRLFKRRSIRIRHVVAIMVVTALVFFYIGTYYNATKIMDSALPVDTSVVRDIGYIEPVSDRLEVGML